MKLANAQAVDTKIKKNPAVKKTCEVPMMISDCDNVKSIILRRMTQIAILL